MSDASTAYERGLQANRERNGYKPEVQRVGFISRGTICGEDTPVLSNLRYRADMREWLQEPSVSHPHLTNEQFMKQHVMDDLQFHEIISSQHLTRYEWWPDLALNLYELDPDTIVGRMKITPNTGVCSYRLQGVRNYLCIKYKMGAIYYKPPVRQPSNTPLCPVEKKVEEEEGTIPWMSYRAIVFSKRPPNPLPKPDTTALRGWLSPKGELYPCGFENHHHLRYDLEKQLGIKNVENTFCKVGEDQKTRTIVWSAPAAAPITIDQRVCIMDHIAKFDVAQRIEGESTAETSLGTEKLAYDKSRVWGD